MSRPPEALAKRRRRRPPSLRSWNKRDPLNIIVQHRGGAESWWQLTARGHIWRFPGHLALEDVLLRVMSGENPAEKVGPRKSSD